MERFVSRAGFGVVAVESVAAAVAALKDEQFAMLVTDGVLQDGDANDVIRAFRLRHPGEPIVVCSGYLEKPVAVAGVSRGDWVSLRKPFDPGDLVALVVKALGPPADEASKPA
jgi:two-component system response regulator HydG